MLVIVYVLQGVNSNWEVKETDDGVENIFGNGAPLLKNPFEIIIGIRPELP